MTEPLVIIQHLGLFENKQARQEAKLAMRLPVIKIAHSTVAVAHFVSSIREDRVLEYDNLVFAQPQEIGLKLQEGLLRATPFSAHPFGSPKNIELVLGETARFEWRRLLKVNIMTHKVINIALVQRPVKQELFFHAPDHLIHLELS
ncbi:hypothetical protein GO986_06840 [Deinococcus sp. HMF7620]|uniref:Uncharacterized protein n=1 Tax=Deinococcus arboris TaxID=2682977 RepID=A0A7C9M7X8_9DEIO|nr:hypothetical protein [Deinococcus arboris]MVN86479.1 hypothetical protein [Deinococcus arboris]